jgi:YQGE family putative transporter
MNLPIWILLMMNTVFSCVLSFSSIYINIYIWDQNNSLAEIGIFNTAVFAFLFLGKFFGNFTIKWFNTRVSFILSSVILLAVFGLLMKEGPFITDHIVLLGILYGTSLGFYYAAYNLSTLLLTSLNNRQRFMGMEQFSVKLTSVLTPVLFSYMIVHFDYAQTFRMVFIMILAQTSISLLAPSYQSEFRVSSMISKPLWKPFKMVFLSIIAFGFLQSITQLAGSILLYQFVQQEEAVGWLNTLFALIGIVVFIRISQQKAIQNRAATSYIGFILGTTMTFLLFTPDFPHLISFNILAAIAIPFLWIPISATHYGKIKILSRLTHGGYDIGLASSYLLVWELMLNIGRTLFYALLIVGFDFQHSAHYFFIGLLTVVIPLIIYLCNKGLLQEASIN